MPDVLVYYEISYFSLHCVICTVFSAACASFWYSWNMSEEGAHLIFKANGGKTHHPLQTFSKLVFLASLETVVILDSMLLSSADQSQRRQNSRGLHTGAIVFSQGKEMTWWLFHFGSWSWPLGDVGYDCWGKSMERDYGLLQGSLSGWPSGLVFPKEIRELSDTAPKLWKPVVTLLVWYVGHLQQLNIQRALLILFPWHVKYHQLKL